MMSTPSGSSTLLYTADLSSQQQIELLDNLFTGSPNGIVVYRPLREETGVIYDFTVVSVNPAALRLSNQSVERVMTQTLLERYPDTKQSGLFDRYVELLQSGQAFSFESYIKDQGCWYSMTASPLNDGFVINFSDITDRKLTEIRHQELANTLNSVLDGSINSIMSFRAIRNSNGSIIDFEILTANRAAENYLQLSEAQMVGQQLLELFPENLSMGLFDMYVRTIETGQPQRMQALYTENGQYLWLDESSTRLSEDSLVVTFMDITESRQALEKTQHQAEWLRVLLDGSISGMLALEPIRDSQQKLADLRITMVNQAAEVLLERRERELIGKSVTNIYANATDIGLFSFLSECIHQNRTARREFTVKTANSELWLDVSASPTASGSLVVSFLNVTQNRLFQRQLEASVLELQQSNKNLEQFAYVASHDLQEPLRKVQSFGDVLADQYGEELGEKGMDLLRRMRIAARRMSTLINDLLAYSRLSASQTPFKPVNLNQLVAEVLDDLETNIREKGARIHIGALPTIQGDASQLGQLFQNLLSNALKFNKPGVQPEIRVSANLHMDPSEERYLVVEIIVEDNGIGFDPSQAQRIFQVFQRLHSRNEYGGTGIGLAIVQKIAENHGGEIMAEGVPNKGATFKLLLPIN